ncbi:MAG TPA: UPF0182 family protein [Pyrinomonadaceae bacterium]|nr:UPF0182 family protein [Pyrinomonadaceae bacterium]
MSQAFPVSDAEIIDVEPPRRRRWLRWVIAAGILVLILGSRALSVFLSALWFGSLGLQDVYWYILKTKVVLFAIFFLLTAGILRLAFWWLERTLAIHGLVQRTIIVNNQPIQFSPARVVRPFAWIAAVLAGLYYGLAMKNEWLDFARYFHHPAGGPADPIFNKPLSFYLFVLPLYDLLSSWLLTLTFIVLGVSVLAAALLLPQQILKSAKQNSAKAAFGVVSITLAAFLLALAARTYLSRFPYLWQDHQSFSGITYVEANYTLPVLLIVSIALIAAAAIALLNAFTKRGLRLILIGVALPLAVYIVGAVIVPAYVQGFVVKPNELQRETPYIEHNIRWTRAAFGLDQIDSRDFDAEPSVEALNLSENRATLDNIRLWDWRALQDTLQQIQAIRIYYDFPDVDVDRYSVGGQVRQMMTATREMNISRLPDQSRNWINERLIYTHGYGVTMNTANGFTPEGMPQFILSNMPIESKAPEIKVTRPQIYYGQETDTHVYVKTQQREFDFPQGETTIFTSYEGSGGIPIGSGLRRMLLAWALGDLSKLPFSDDVTAESRVLLNRNISKMVNGIAPFLIYDDDPYIVINEEGQLFWMIDAFTESATYPYSRHHQVDRYRVNYIRNSVKVVIDAYNGSVRFYVFDPVDPLILSYRAIFPSLFANADEMPADLRSHIRYPETLIKVQGEVFGLYHTQNPKVFFQREDVWSVAQELSAEDPTKKQGQPLEPYYVLMQLPGEESGMEFAIILPFTPANRNNMIGWMAGRCDGPNYGKLLVYNFPESRLIDGPLQIEARIDQNAQLSAQFSLWNQQGSKVLRGHLLVIPVGRSLLYVEPVYLQAVRSPMPELRLVVLGIHERIGYGSNFNEAMTNLFGQAAERPPVTTGESGEGTVERPTELLTPTTPASNQTIIQLINRAVQEFEDYQRLTAEGKHGEAGQKLEQHKRTLEELRRTSGRP